MENEITTSSFIKSYWNYYLELEEQMLSTKRFVDFDKNNYKTFSLEYLELLQAACSEIDVVAKIIAEAFDDEFKNLRNKNIQKWGYVLHKAFPNIEQIKALFLNDFSVSPWENWEYEKFTDKENKLRYHLKKSKKTPKWWTAYNKVKHERTSSYNGDKINYCQANLENLIYAMSALFIIESLFIEHLNKEENICYNKSSLFTIEKQI